MLKNLTPRAIAALAVVAVSSFLVLCVCLNGGAVFASAKAAQSAGFTAHLSGWLVENVGAGLWAILILPMVWSAIVYFEEKTPDLVLRLVGTLVLAFAISTIAGLLHSGLWAGHVGNAAANSLGALSARLGGFGTAIAWLLTLSLLGVSLVFATDWMFHSLRRAGRTVTAASEEIAVEPVAAVLLEDPAETEPREFVRETPRAAVAAAEMEDVVEVSSVEAETPSGWDETEDDGRTIIAAPSGYRGVEFLQPSDELAIPEPVAPRMLREEPGEVPGEPHSAPSFHDDELVTTPDAAFFVESPEAQAEAETQEMDFAAVRASSFEDEQEDVVDDAVQTLFEAVTTPGSAPAEVAAAAAPSSGIGLPEDSPFHDEFFAADAGWPFAANPAAASDGASAAAEMAGTYSAPRPAQEPVAAPEAAEVEEPALADEEFALDEVLVSRLPEAAFDDSVPAYESSGQADFESAPAVLEPAGFSTEPTESAVELVEAVGVALAEAPAAQLGISLPEPVAERGAEPMAAVTPEIAQPAPQLDLFAATAAPSVEPIVAPPSPAAAVAPPDLSRIHALELDPMFHDAVGAVLERGRASAVVLQRQLGIGYARGIRILDQMTATGLVGPDTPSGSREIRVTRDAWQAFVAA